jgi:GxxExxY protein
MPILHNAPVRTLSDDEFEAIDRVVMQCAYASQNRLGRLCEEAVYENDMAARLRAVGFTDVHLQVPVTATFRHFEKTYRLDMIVHGMVYEFKAADCLAPAHDAQVIHYAALVHADRIKLINFGGAKVEGKLRRCPFHRMDRFQTVEDRQRWKPVTDRCRLLAETAAACLQEWGGFLDARLFAEALLHFLGREERLPVTRDGFALGHHRVALHGDQVAFVVTSLEDGRIHERHLRSLLECLPLKAWQWINLHGTTMEMITVQREDKGIGTRE